MGPASVSIFFHSRSGPRSRPHRKQRRASFGSSCTPRAPLIAGAFSRIPPPAATLSCDVCHCVAAFSLPGRYAVRLFFFTAWGFFLPRGLGGASSCHCVTTLFCPAGARPLGACSPPLAARRDSSGCDPEARLGPGSPRCPQETASPIPQPRSTRRVPAASGGMTARTRWADGIPTTSKTVGRTLEGTCQVLRDDPGRSAARGRVAGRSAPRATGAITPERAGPERPDRRVETLAPTERLMRRRGTARVRTTGCACSVAREGGSEGCARCAARATAQSPRGKTKPSPSDKEEFVRALAGQDKAVTP